MSGLLPRNPTTASTGNFTNLSCQNLVVTGSASIKSLALSTINAVSATISGAASVGSLALSIDPAVDTGTTALMYDGVNMTIGKKVVTDLSSAQTLTNKTIDSAANLVEVNGTNINTLLGQPVLTTSSPTFRSIVTVNGTTGTTMTLNAGSVTLGNCLVYSDGTHTHQLSYVAPTSTRQALLPDGSGTIVLDTLAQTLTNKTFTAPIISTIVNTGTLTLPTTTGTLALTSQIPTNANYVDLTTAQTITGGKTFSTAPIISTITNTGTLTLPTTTDTLVGRATTDTLSSKSLVDSSCIFTGHADPSKLFFIDTSTSATTGSTTVLRASTTSTATLTLPSATTNIIGDATTNTLTNKAIDTGSNTITVASTALTSIIAAANPLLTTSTPQHARIGLGVASDQAFLLTNDITQNDKIVIWRGGVVNSHQFFGLGLGVNMQRYQVNNSGSDHVFYCGASTTTSTELFRVKGAGGITLPTTGGTASTLNFFEQNTIVFTFSGPPASGQTITVSIQRSGNQVSMYLPALSTTATSSTNFTSGVTLPARWVPVVNSTFPILIQDASTFQTTPGEIDILTNGTVNIYKAAPSVSFTGSGTCGWKATHFSWLIA